MNLGAVFSFKKKKIGLVISQLFLVANRWTVTIVNMMAIPQKSHEPGCKFCSSFHLASVTTKGKNTYVNTFKYSTVSVHDMLTITAWDLKPFLTLLTHIIHKKRVFSRSFCRNSYYNLR